MSVERAVVGRDRVTLAVWLCLLHRIDLAVLAIVVLMAAADMGR